MRILSLLSLFILSASAAHGAESTKLSPGRYVGVDQARRPCEFFLVPEFGSDQVRNFRLILASSHYFSFLNVKPALPESGVISGRDNLMADGYIEGRSYYRSFSGAPIFARVIETQYELRYARGLPLSITHQRRPLGGNGSFQTETCVSLKKAAP